MRFGFITVSGTTATTNSYTPAAGADSATAMQAMITANPTAALYFYLDSGQSASHNFRAVKKTAEVPNEAEQKFLEEFEIDFPVGYNGTGDSKVEDPQTGNDGTTILSGHVGPGWSQAELEALKNYFADFCHPGRQRPGDPPAPTGTGQQPSMTDADLAEAENWAAKYRAFKQRG